MVADRKTADRKDTEMSESKKQMKEAEEGDKQEEQKQEEQKIENDSQIIRLNAQMLQSGDFVAQKVAIVGKYTYCFRGSYIYTAVDGGTFKVNVKNPQRFTRDPQKFVTIVGYVNADNSMNVLRCESMVGKDINPTIWNKFVILTHKFPNLF